MNIDNYGFTFNNITINGNIFKKEYKNLMGKQKINNEINFYLYIVNNNIDFPIPKLLDYQDGILSIEYINNSCTLINKIDSNNIYEYINIIKKKLAIIHNIKIQVSLDTIQKDLYIEVYKKVLDRFTEFDWKNNLLYNSIKSVNGLKIKDINYYCNIIKTNIIYQVKNRVYYNIIHGDTHLGNILLDKNDNLFFIDPRGYFGETQLFGLYEYDYAKLLFGLSGYSVFDNMTINEVEIKNNNIEIKFIKNYEYIFKTGDFNKLTILFCLSIWLGNNSCFSNINKKITSIMIAYYYCEKYIDDC
jgi:tRNA A-37 threonylcarbamoyl transferase component Bud32